MSNDVKQEHISLLGKEYTVACPPEEREGLLKSAHMLDGKMREIRNRGKIVGTEGIVVMAALNVIHDLIQEQQGGQHHQQDFELRLRLLYDKIETALEQEDRQLTL
jgi:cell division protein ZapA